MEQAPEQIEWSESTIRQLVDTVKVLSKDKIEIYLRGGTVIEQNIERELGKIIRCPKRFINIPWMELLYRSGKVFPKPDEHFISILQISRCVQKILECRPVDSVGNMLLL